MQILTLLCSEFFVSFYWPTSALRWLLLFAKRLKYLL